MLSFPESIDNTLISTFRMCDRKAYWNKFYPLSAANPGIVLSETPIDLSAGKAFAYGVERVRWAFYIDGKSAKEAIEIGQWAIFLMHGNRPCHAKPLKHWTVLCLALEAYFGFYPLGKGYIEPIEINGKLTIEFNFAVPLPGITHPITGNPILFTGRTDLIGRESGQLILEDDKTTTQLGKSWFNQWPLSSQITGYYWALSQYGIHPALAKIRGIGLYSNRFEFVESLQFRTPAMVDEWLKGVQITVARMIVAWKMEFFPKAGNNACSAYSGCPYLDICVSPNPAPAIPLMYVPNTWNPLANDHK